MKASREEVFTAIDAHSQLSAHMGQRSAMMGGGAMRLELDPLEGRGVGARMRLSGSAFGVRVEVEEVVTRRDPPHRKTWETIGTPKLLVIGPYRMNVEIAEEGAASRLLIQIDYELPARGLGRWLGLLLGHAYASWCTSAMLSDIQRQFAGKRTAVNDDDGVE